MSQPPVVRPVPEGSGGAPPAGAPSPEASGPRATAPGGAGSDGAAAPGGRAAGSLRRTVRDVVLSMGLVAAIIAIAMAVSWRPPPDPVREVEAAPVAQAAAAVTPYPLLYPRVGDDWRATSARFSPTAESDDEPVWFNGWVTPEGQYVAIVQSAATSEDFVTEQTIDGVPARVGGPEAPIPGWTAFLSRDGEQRSLVRRTDAGTTIVTGSLDWAGLVRFREALAPVGRS